MSNPYRKDFPLLNQKERSKPLIYLDNAATTQKPDAVLNAMEEYYKEYNANPYRGLYDISEKATEKYEEARRITAEFIHAKDSAEIIFTRNATESLNLIAYSFGRSFLKEGEEILIPISEHHSNLLPWQQLAREKKAVLNYLYLDESGNLSEEELEAKITEKTRIVAFAYVSNVLGTIYPVKEIVEKAHSVGAVTVVDCAQSIPHYPLDVEALGVDFAVFSGHKMLGPMGIGVLYGKKALLESMPPFLTGGEMIDFVSEQEATFAPLPQKFEAGTPNVGGAIGLMEAIAYIKDTGYDKIKAAEEELTAYALDRLRELSYVTIYGEKYLKENRSGVISFNVEGVHPHDVSSLLDADGVCIRAGHHCAQPLMHYMGVAATCRASFYFYNTKEDIDSFIESLKKVRRWLGIGN
ncbi:cysteine desulfurase [Anaerocolumna xylanovorans]|uniref:Cysteine desulfurase n=1 Tax=Anaerocolumna xylanovorans DSM 12503 TaxID=1121345 RepID=A0A1M7Y001_9FIRM|nr:cysteine desulfurase [Anaerocolumna xylanovorans]SHO44885.1 cysteine desulfurase [Anaerocolumna xylanovorans DSM 12503]